MFWETKNNKEIDELNYLIRTNLKDIEDIKHKLALLEAKLETLKETKTISEQDKDTLAELSIKMSKLWGLLLEKTPNGKEKLSKSGKRYGGKLQQNF